MLQAIFSYETSFYTLVAALAILTVSSVVISYSAVTALQVITTENNELIDTGRVRIQYDTIHYIRYVMLCYAMSCWIIKHYLLRSPYFLPSFVHSCVYHCPCEQKCALVHAKMRLHVLRSKYALSQECPLQFQKLTTETKSKKAMRLHVNTLRTNNSSRQLYDK